MLLPLPGEGWDGGTAASDSRQWFIERRCAPTPPSPGRGGRNTQRLSSAPRASYARSHARTPRSSGPTRTRPSPPH
ncbi:hypothetical protein CY658_28275 [Variovorax sp. RO1]|nr:hypothetical protein CY658_28275 [Variovorax sp. RO1]